MAAERVETLVKEYILSGGYKLAIYTVTIAATDDWIDVSDNFELVRYCSGYKTADGTDGLCYCAGTDALAYFATNTAASSTIMVIGTSVDSVGGAT